MEINSIRNRKKETFDSISINIKFLRKSVMETS